MGKLASGGNERRACLGMGNSVNHIKKRKPGELGTMLDGKNTICSFGYN
jgi:hypothetical protein